jgi:predicted transposase YbfD/YdcC
LQNQDKRGKITILTINLNSMVMAKLQQKNGIIAYLKNIKEPRKTKSIQHKLIDILAIAICAVISGAEGWDDIAQYGRQKIQWLKTFLELPHGIPSHDTFARVFGLIDPEEFRKSFLSWVNEITELVHGEVIAVDGKTARRSHSDGKHPLHVVSAWATQNCLVLGQLATEEKSNEITAIPKLLDMLLVKGHVVTIDAMGCQKDIAAKIKAKEADYVLALKGNQATIHDEVKKIFNQPTSPMNANFHEETSRDHGRMETRKCGSIILGAVNYFKEQALWAGLKSIIKIESIRTVKNKTTKETRYYLSSLKTTARKFNRIIRSHWGIENSLHWVLDMSFREDESRIRAGHSAENLGILRHMALNLLKQENTLKRGVKGKRLMAGWDNDYLLKVLQPKLSGS